MANARGLIVAAALVAAAPVSAASRPCEEDRARTGLALAAGEDGLTIAVVDDGSPAAAHGLRKGDVVVQVNGMLPRACSDWSRAVREARKDRKALLVLVRREGNDTVAAVPSSTWDRAVAEAPPPEPVEPPSVKTVVAEPPPPPLPPETQVSVDEVLRGIGGLASDKPSFTLDAYRKNLLHARRQVETLAIRKSVRPDVVDGFRTVLRYYDAAEVAWDAELRQRERDRRPRHLPAPDNMPATFFTSSEEAAVIDEFPFLRETVTREPSATVILSESSGYWRPIAARRLLWSHGGQELARLTGWLGGTPTAP
jgi:hypothetical protein